VIAVSSHQWTAWDAPDPSNKQFECMAAALDMIIDANGYTIEETWVWVDYLSIPQRCRGMQQLAINSLPMYTSVANAFCIVAPPLTHEHTKQLCDLQTYNRRLWCRTENFCHTLRHGCDDIWVATSPTSCSKLFARRKGDGASDGDGEHGDGGGRAFLQQNLRVFEGDCTVEADKLQLMPPFLGLYAEIYALAYARLAAQVTSAEGSAEDDSSSIHPESTAGSSKVSWVMSELLRHKDAIFPPTITMRVKDEVTGEEEAKEVTLFGELLRRVEATIRTNAATRELLLARHSTLVHASADDRFVDVPGVIHQARPRALIGRFVTKMKRSQRSTSGERAGSASSTSTSVVEVSRPDDVELAAAQDARLSGWASARPPEQ